MCWTKLKFGALVVLGAVCAGAAAALCYDRSATGLEGPSRAATASNVALKGSDKNARGATEPVEGRKVATEIKPDPPPKSDKETAPKQERKREKEEDRALDMFAFDRFNGGIPLSFLTHKSVQEDLKMTDQQVRQADAAYQKHSEAMQNLRSLKQADRGNKQFELSQQAFKVIRDVLNADQQKRLRQICLQQQGVRALHGNVLGTEAIIKELGLSEDQQYEVADIIRAANKKGQAVRLGDHPHSEEANEKMEAIQKELNDKVLSVLTAEQKTKWNEMTGKPFTGPRMIGR